MNQRKVLAIGAHPDDMEQFCGGTLLLLHQKGYETRILSITAGECGSSKLSAEAITKIRLNEAKEGAAILGADFRCLGIHDGFVSVDLDTVKKLVSVIRGYRPSIIFTHPTVDYRTDHSHTGDLVLWAAPEATHTNFPVDTQGRPMESQPYVYHTDPQGLIGPDGQIVKVNTIVDISTVIEPKLKAFAAHKSQIERKQGEPIEKTRRWAITRGQQVRVEYGEGFTQQLFEQYPRRNILAEILGAKVFTL